MSPHALRHAIAGSLVLLGGCAAVDAPVPAPAAPPAVRSDPPDAAPPPATVATEGIAYTCDDGSTLRVRFGDGVVTIAGLPQGEESLLRDAGGVTPEQTVWSNGRLRAEFGLPPGGEGAALHPLQPPAPAVGCRRQ